MDKSKEYPLNSEWNLWYHSIKDNNWTKDSYKQIYISRIYMITK